MEGDCDTKASFDKKVRSTPEDAIFTRIISNTRICLRLRIENEGVYAGLLLCCVESVVV